MTRKAFQATLIYALFYLASVFVVAKKSEAIHFETGVKYGEVSAKSEIYSVLKDSSSLETCDDRPEEYKHLFSLKGGGVGFKLHEAMFSFCEYL